MVTTPSVAGGATEVSVKVTEPVAPVDTVATKLTDVPARAGFVEPAAKANVVVLAALEAGITRGEFRTCTF